MGIKDKLGGVRRKSGNRMILIIFLLVIVAVMFYFWKAARVWLVGLFIVLLAALGLETSGNDWDLGKLFQTGSFSESKVQKTDNGTWKIGEECNKDTLNCANFTYQEDAQDLFDKCGGTTNDINGLDRDKDGIVCESLPSKNKK
jgi:hypothetical protein